MGRFIQKIHDLYFYEKLSGRNILELGYRKCDLYETIGNQKRSRSEAAKAQKKARKIRSVDEKRALEINELYFKKMFSRRDIERLGYKRWEFNFAIKNKREHQNACQVFKNSHPCTELTKEKLRQKRIEFLSKYDGPVGWGATNKNRKMTAEEKKFLELIIKHGVHKKYKIINEYRFYTYRFDFAFLEIKLDVEIDGPKHFHNGKRIERDFKRDEFTISKNWKVYRINHKDIVRKSEITFLAFLEYLKHIENRA